MTLTIDLNGLPAGRAIRIARAALGVSQLDLARAAGIHNTLLSKFENDKRQPRGDNLARLHAALVAERT